MQPLSGHQPGRPLRSPLVAHGSWFGAGALLSAHLAFSAFGDRDLLAAIVLGVATVLLFFVCAALHATAHIAVAKILRQPRVRARLYVFGDTQRRDAPVPPSRKEIAVALAGPVMSGGLGVGLLVAADVVDGWPSHVLQTTAWTNIGLAALNLLPGLPLDGGRVLRQITQRPRLPVLMGRSIGLVATIGGIWLLLGGLTVIDDTAFALWLLLVGVFILMEADPGATDDAIAFDLGRDTVGAWARPFAGRLQPSDLVPNDDAPYAVADGRRLAGVLAADRRVQRGARTGDVMVPWSNELGMPATAPLARALERLAERRQPIVVVVDERGVVRGVLDETTVRERLVGA